MKRFILLCLLSAITAFPSVRCYSKNKDRSWIDTSARKIEDEVIQWRHHLHQYPELGNFEYKTADYIAAILKDLGISTTTGVAKTGVIGILKGDLPGPVIALRADIDGLPVKEETGLPFASEAKGNYFGKEVDVMHACGHDTHTAMLLGAAKVLAENKQHVAGTVVFIFQPAEEGAADVDPYSKNASSQKGAKRMIEEGVLSKNKVQAVFGLHVMSGMPSGEIFYKGGAILNSADGFRVTVNGKQTHGSMPWLGDDAIVASAQIITSLQTLVSRKADLSLGMGVISIGSIQAGSAPNIIPGKLTFEGTIRSNHPTIRNVLLSGLPPLTEKVAEANNTLATVEITELVPVTMNDRALTKAMAPYLSKAADGRITELTTNAAASEDFSFFAEEVPGLFYFLGATPQDMDMKTAASNHHPKFIVDDAALLTGVKAHVWTVIGFSEIGPALFHEPEK